MKTINYFIITGITLITHVLLFPIPDFIFDSFGSFLQNQMQIEPRLTDIILLMTIVPALLLYLIILIRSSIKNKKITTLNQVLIIVLIPSIIEIFSFGVAIVNPSSGLLFFFVGQANKLVSVPLSIIISCILFKILSTKIRNKIDDSNK